MRDTEQQIGDSAFIYEVSANESVSEGVVRAVSIVSGAAPVPGASSEYETSQVLEPLHSAINPEALDSVFRHTTLRPVQPRARLTFTYHGHVVTVTGRGRISVEPLEASTVEAAD